ncbi:MAG: hypothetical protein K5770_01850 [Lachnospiraceae bacterium]|nr:hypothetical protein [Lachnospiraceae bacterium]
MEDTQMVGILMMFFGGAFVVFAGLSALSPGFLKKVVFWRAGSIFDDAHPKEQARAWAKAMLLMALGPFLGGLAMYLLGGVGKGGIGGIILLASCIFFFVKGGKYAHRETKRLMGGDGQKPQPGPQSGPQPGLELECTFCGTLFQAGKKKCPKCGAPAGTANIKGTDIPFEEGVYLVTASMEMAARIAMARSEQWSRGDYDKPVWEDADHLLRECKKEDERMRGYSSANQMKYVVSPEGAVGYLGVYGAELKGGGDIDWVWYTPKRHINELPTLQSRVNIQYLATEVSKK